MSLYAVRDGVSFYDTPLLHLSFMPAAVTWSPTKVYVDGPYWDAAEKGVAANNAYPNRREQLFAHELEHTRQAATHRFWLLYYLFHRKECETGAYTAAHELLPDGTVHPLARR